MIQLKHDWLGRSTEKKSQEMDTQASMIWCMIKVAFSIKGDIWILNKWLRKPVAIWKKVNWDPYLLKQIQDGLLILI